MPTTHYTREERLPHQHVMAACSCSWEGTAFPHDPEGQEAARLESCRHLASVMRFGSVVIGGDHYLVPKS